MNRSVIAVGALLVLGACSRDGKGLGDAPVGGTDEAPRRVWTSPDQFMNIAAFCIGENGAYVHTRAAAPVIIPDDPNCDEGGILAIAPETTAG